MSQVWVDRRKDELIQILDIDTYISEFDYPDEETIQMFMREARKQNELSFIKRLAELNLISPSELREIGNFRLFVENMDLEGYLSLGGQLDQIRIFKFLKQAITEEDDSVIDQLYIDGYVTGSDISNELFSQGKYSDLEAYLQAGFPLTQKAEFMAVGKSDLNALDELEWHGSQPTQTGADLALTVINGLTGIINVLQWYWDHGLIPTPPMGSIENILIPEILDWLDQHKIPYQINPDRDFLILQPLPDMTEALIRRGYLPGDNAINKAIRNNDFETIDLYMQGGIVDFTPEQLDLAETASQEMFEFLMVD